MSYLSLGAVSVPSAQQKALNTVLPLVAANRQFFSRVIVKWLDNNRGMPGFLGGEAGVRNGGKRGTTLNGKFIDMTQTYGALKQSKNQKNARYDVQRAVALSVMAKRDFAHLVGSCISVITGIGEVDIEADISSSEAQGFDWGALLQGFLEIFPAIIGAVSQLLSFLPAEAPAENTVVAPAPSRAASTTFAPISKGSVIKPAVSAKKESFPVVPALAAAGLVAFLVLRK